MKPLKLLVMLGLLAMLLGGCVGKATRAEKQDIVLPPGTLNAAEVAKLFAGKSVESVLSKNGRVSLTYYKPDGSLRQLQNGVRRSGVWRVREDGRICLDFAGERERCRIIVKSGDTYFKYIVKNDGQHERIITYRSFRDGNLVD